VVRAYLGVRWRGGALRDGIDDAVQDVFMDCFKSEGALGRIDRGRGIGFRTFLYGVVRMVARRHEERAGKKRDTAPSGFDEAAIEADMDPLSCVWDRAWAQTMLKRAGARQRVWAEMDGAAGKRRLDLLRLRFRDGLPIREIAVSWKTDPAKLHAEFRRAREEFKRALREEVAFHSPGAPVAVEKECERLLASLG
jgi:DNA-directed RNA polymerase specialized sigma24 family protein